MTGRPLGKVPDLTPRQREAMISIVAFVKERGYAPSTGDLGKRLGVTPQSTFYLVKELTRKGYLRREPGAARGLTVVRSPEPEPTLEKSSIPAIGLAAAGNPIFSEGVVLGYVEVDASIARRGPCFALRVEGHSMSDAGIQDRGFIVVRRQPIAQSGDIVVALLNGETTVKTLQIHEEVIELRPQNRRFKPIRVQPTDQLQIVGKVVAVLPPGSSFAAPNRRTSHR